MTIAQHRLAARPFFLDTPRRKRFCLYHAPSPQHGCVGAILYVHPFGEEMNMSRRMAALQSRAFADAGYGVLQIDLFGCGDSDGELRDADLGTWRRDLVSAAEWLCKHASPALSLWGLRLGATLALDAICSDSIKAQQCILWQPVIAAHAYMTQFLRLGLASDMMSAQGQQTRRKQGPRDALLRGETVEIGGYELSPTLVTGIDGLDFSGLRSVGLPVHWFELTPDEQAPMPAVRMNIARAWSEREVDVRPQTVTGPAFWATREVIECPQLIAETTDVFLQELA